jgi:hypothetical protein
MTLLTWWKGPQMIGFSLAHTMPVVFILGGLSLSAAAIWCIIVTGAVA